MARPADETQVRCPYCSRLFDPDQIESHIASSHPEND